ncbi:Inositol polyphosphate 5-phosphatase [Handroanthus impetiginosus]|uniref:Inositol polyphosphate 5-phosphatase n=1 Tax=Handroanthus impetiginosus TaxID=429701 RepID=A0A2G9GA22_9LAMI|nr:Inositol polyphosphate 5-phosphatase [Handroanthus impetiginosus]
MVKNGMLGWKKKPSEQGKRDRRRKIKRSQQRKRKPDHRRNGSRREGPQGPAKSTTQSLQGREKKEEKRVLLFIHYKKIYFFLDFDLKVMWPRLVASKILRKRLGGNNFVADFTTDIDSNNCLLEDINPPLKHKSFSSNSCSFINDDHQEIRNFKVYVSTWNVGGVAPSEDLNMDELIEPSINHCDIYVFGFQEVVPLKVGNVLGSEKSKISMKWDSLIRAALMKMNTNTNINNNSGFRCIISKQMVGILISVWVRTELRPYVRNPSVSCVGCGVMGCLGNKGAVSVRFRLHETSFCFVCSHLASGGRQGDQRYRNSDAAEILSRTIFTRGPSLDLPRKILDHERVIFLGDLNYRISLPESATRLLVDKGDWNALLEYDQLRIELMEGQVFEGWKEGTIKFAPTYKYYPNSDEYYGKFEAKRGEKKRVPAWCDRIIWHGEGLKQHVYERGESKLSDHRPVMAIFSTQVRVKLKLKALQNFFLSDRFQHITNSLDHDFSCNAR